MSVKKFPLVSIVITTKNEEKNIRDCLQSIKDQSYPQRSIEIIVVDNNSTDRTKKIAYEFTDKVFNKGPERSAQRNLGAQKSRGEYYLYVDADMTLSKNVISDAVQMFEKNKQLTGLYISEIVTGTSYWSQVRRFERSFYDATVIDCVRMVRTKDFLEIGGFDESMSGPEDWDFDKKIRQKGKTALLKTPIYHNEAEFNLKKYISKKGYYAQSFATYIKKWGSDDSDIKKQLGFPYRFVGVFLQDGHWIRLIRNPHLTLGMYLLRFMVGCKYLSVKFFSSSKSK